MSIARRIIVVNDHPLYLEALARAVQRSVEHAAVEAVDSLEQLSARLGRDDAVDLIVLDLNMPDFPGLSGLSLLRDEYPRIPVVAIAATEEPSLAYRALQLGASALVPKSAPVAVLQEALQTVIAGRTWVGVDLDGVSGDIRIGDAEKRLGSLTPQQLRVLSLMSRGLLNKQIAHQLGLAEATVKSHASAIMRKLGVTNRTQAVLMVRDMEMDLGGGSDGPR